MTKMSVLCCSSKRCLQEGLGWLAGVYHRLRCCCQPFTCRTNDRHREQAHLEHPQNQTRGRYAHGSKSRIRKFASRFWAFQSVMICRRRNGFGPFRRFRIGDSRWSRTHVLSTTILLRMLRGVAKGLGLQVGLLIPMPLALPVCSIQATVACVLGLASITSPVPCQSMRCQTVREVLLLREHTARRWRSPQS